MPTFDDSILTAAAPEKVWMLLYDPLRFPEWWTGVESTTTQGSGEYTMYSAGYPDFPMPQTLDTSPGDSRVTISCMVSDLVFAWQLEVMDGGTKISVHVEIPEREAARLDAQREVIESSLRRLGALAAAE